MRRNQVVPMYGGGFFQDVVRFGRKNKVVSRGLTAAAPAAGSYAPAVLAAGTVAGILGFGKPRGAGRKRGVGKRKKRTVRRR